MRADERAKFRRSRRRKEAECSTLVKFHLLTSVATVLIASSAFAEDRTQPTIDGLIGPLFGDHHSYMAETRVLIPLVHEDNWSLRYQQKETTPVLRESSQTQLLNLRNQFEADFQFAENFRLLGVAGYHRTAFQDRPGLLDACEVGLGLGSPVRAEVSRFEWRVAVGGFAHRRRLDADWWSDIHLAWRVYGFPEREMGETKVRPWLSFEADVESANNEEKFRGHYRVGPVLELPSANGNRARFRAQWWANDGNPFYEDRSSSLLLGVEVSASLDTDKLYNARENRPTGWLPLVWGQYDLGYGGERSIQRTELTAEFHDSELFDQLLTGVLTYESRQEYRPGDYDNISYTVGIGAQARVGLASLLSQDQPLVVGVDYLHRSAHVLAPEADRVPAGETLPHNSINLGPRLRVQTLGWDLPYRDPGIYAAETRWLNRFDWRLTIGHDFHHSRKRANPSGQVGLNWDAAAIRGCVLYARGLGSIGNETPDWQAEAGVRRPRGKLFFRYERYGLEGWLARGNAAVAGIGFAL